MIIYGESIAIWVMESIAIWVKESHLLTPTWKPCTLCLYVVLLLVNIFHLLLCIRDNICMEHGVRMDQKILGTVAHQVGVWVTVFENWFRTLINWFRIGQNSVSRVAGLKKPVILLFDGHGSYLTYNTIKSGIDKRIIICIPPSTSRALQPCWGFLPS